MLVAKFALIIFMDDHHFIYNTKLKIKIIIIIIIINFLLIVGFYEIPPTLQPYSICVGWRSIEVGPCILGMCYTSGLYPL